MAASPRHKKARILRDFMIETQTVNMFKEEEKNDTIFFRSIYPMGEEKNEAVLACLNECNLELPTVKYVLTKDQCVIVSMFFPVDEAHFNAGLIMGVVVQVMKNVAERHFDKIKAALA